MPNILYIGAGGFIGSKTVKLLLKQSRKNKVTVFDNFSIGALDNIPKTANIIIGDIKSHRALLSVFASKKYDTVVVGCGPVDMFESLLSSQESYEKNVYGALNMCRVLEIAENKPKRIIFLSSLSVFGAGAEVIEASAINTLTPYAQSFKVAEDILKLNCNLLGIEFLTLRLPEVYGRIKDSKDTISLCINNFIDKTSFIVYGNNTVIRDFVYVEELAKHLVTVITDESFIGEFNFGGQPINLAALITEISKKLDANIKLVNFSEHKDYKYGTLYANYALLNSKSVVFEVKVRDVIDDIIAGVKKFRLEQDKKVKMFG
jgi:UDP-glucose 4-epimerase